MDTEIKKEENRKKIVYEKLKSQKKWYIIRRIILYPILIIGIMFSFPIILVSIDKGHIHYIIIYIILFLICLFSISFLKRSYKKYKEEVASYCPYCYTKGFKMEVIESKKLNQYVKWGDLIEEWQTTCKNKCCGKMYNKDFKLKIKKGKYCPYCYCHTHEFTTTTLYNKKIRSYVTKDERTDSNGKTRIKRTLIEGWEGQYRNECCGKVYTSTWQERISLD